jgi:hypothetical protein
MVASTVQPVVKLSSTYQLTQGDEQSEWDQYADKDKKSKCDSAHGILLSFIRP